jgi:hypothetical protein
VNDHGRGQYEQPSPYSADPAPRIMTQTEIAKEARDALPVQPAILKYFACSHLPPQLRAVSQPFVDLAIALIAATPPGPEQSAGLRKLLEAKDCFVRAVLP